MSTIFTAPRHYILIGTILAMAAIILAVALTAGNTQAQTPIYDAPHPCGPGFDEFYDLPEFTVDQVYEGQYAIFDAYYDLDADEPHRPVEEGEPWAGLMSLNFCPPELREEEERDEDGEIIDVITTRQQADIDIDSTIFHVDHVQHTLTAADVANYPFLGDVGDQVYWLRVGDDPNASDFQISFSTALFDEKYWHRLDEQGNPVEPLWYEVEAEHELGLHPRLEGHIYIFDDSPAHGDQPKEAIYNSERSETGEIHMEPGQYRTLQWVFTQAGTYEVEAQLNGHVRKVRPAPSLLPADEKWHPISEQDVVTSDVKQYIFRVGALSLNEQPMFKAPDRQIPENSPAGTNVGHPVPVTGADDDPLTYELSGDGHGDFEVVSVAGGGQIRVANNAVLDYETRAVYQLVLSVSDGQNRANYPEDTVDSTIAVRITLEDVFEPEQVQVTASVTPQTQSSTGHVTFTATAHHLPGGITRYFGLHAANRDGSPDYTLETAADSETAETHTFTLGGGGHAGTRYYVTSVTFTYNGEDTTVYSDPVTVHWTQ